jgi:predicted DNA-binding transcriptional regulator YafY
MRHDRIRRAYAILCELRGLRRGLRTVDLAARLEVSRATIDRDLNLLRDAGIPLAREPCNGETRHRLDWDALPPLQPTLEQAAALHLARAYLRPLEGSELVTQLDALLAGVSLPQPTDSLVSHRAPGAASQQTVATIEAALKSRRRLELCYRAASRGGEARLYSVEPLRLRLVGGSLYLAAHVPAVSEHRTFKVVRIVTAQLLDQPARSHPELSDDVLFGRSVKVWSAQPVDVRVKLGKAVAHLAGEYPLIADQSLERTPEGDVIVAATVAGIIEAMRWVLSWGANAVVLGPESLRDAVQSELTAARRAYDRRPAKRASREPLAVAAVRSTRRPHGTRTKT